MGNVLSFSDFGLCDFEYETLMAEDSGKKQLIFSAKIDGPLTGEQKTMFLLLIERRIMDLMREIDDEISGCAD